MIPSSLSTSEWALAALFALAGVVALVRVWRRASRWRLLLALLQVPCAGLLLGALLLRGDDGARTLIVFTPGDAAVEIPQLPSEAARVALPGSATSARTLPDLATALRRHPDVDHVVVVGGGLETQDLAALGGRALRFVPGAESTVARFVELAVSQQVVAGTWWSLTGRIAGDGVTAVELHDPSGAVIARAAPDADGEFRLHALARAPGRSRFALHLRADDISLQQIDVPINATTPAPLQALVLASAPSPDVRALRRWAIDAGVDVASRIDSAPGLGVRRGDTQFDADVLARLDLLVLDERSWPQSEAQRALLLAAIRDGLGVLVRVTGPVPTRTAADLRTLGLDATLQGKTPTETRAVLWSGVENDPDAMLHAWPLAQSKNAAALLQAADGQVLAPRSNLGRGRIALWPLTDSWRLVSRGQREAHASLWQHVWSSLARARATAPVQVSAWPTVGERVSLCHDTASRVIAPNGTSTPLLRDTRSGCAAFWPEAAGWHRWASDDETAAQSAFHVQAPVATASLRDARRRAATAARATTSGAAAPAPSHLSSDMLRALLLATWLACMTLAWAMERRAFRARPAPDQGPPS